MTPQIKRGTLREREIKKAITNLKDDVENVKTHVCKLDSKVTSIDQGILSAEHTDQIRRVAREEIETEMSEKLNDTEKAQFVEDKFEEAVSVAVREMSERQVRKKSFIVHGIPMCQAKEIKARVDFDKKKLDSVITEGLGLKGKVVAKRITRLGKRNDKERPMKVQLENPQVVSDIIHAAKNLKLKPEFSGITVSSDRTPLERAEWRKLVKLKEERQAMSDAQMDGIKWIIAGNRVVKERQTEAESESEDPAHVTQEGKQGEKWQ